MRPRSGALLGASLATALAGCLDPAAPSRVLSEHVSLYSMVEVGSSLVQVLVEETLVTGGARALEGAAAVVHGAHGSSPLLEGASGPGACFTSAGPGPVLPEPGCYSGLLPQPASGGDSLTLEVTLPDGSVVRGALRTPEMPVATIPADSQRVTVLFRSDVFPITVLPVHLASAAGAFRVDVVTVVDTAYIDASNAPIDPSSCGVSAASSPFRAAPFQGQDDVFVHGVRCLREGVGVPWDSVDLTVQVVSMDENYADYTAHMLCSAVIAKPRAGLGIDGAFGVFGAVAVTELRVRLVLDEQPRVPGDPPAEDDVPQTYPC